MEPPHCERCALVSRVPHAFSHTGVPCGWPDLAATCPDCGQDGERCSFFSENEEENACRSLSRLVTLSLRCQLDGAKRRVESQIRQRVIILSGGEGSQRAVSFATGHVKTYKDSLKLVGGVWLPEDISTAETEFFWDRSVVPWRFSLATRSGAEAVTMRGLHSALGMQNEADPAAETPDLATLAAQVRDLTQIVQSLVKTGERQGGGPPGTESGSTAEAARAAEALRLAQLNQSTAAATGWNPSQTFNLNGNSNASVTVTNGPNADADMVRLLMQGGATAEQIVRFLQSKTPATGPTEHRAAWLQAMEGTSPLCTYTGMHGDTRQSATPKTFTVQTYDNVGSKLTQKITAWPAAKPDQVAVYRLRELGADWKRGLVQANLRLLQITPVVDRALTPAIPLDVDGFLDHCYACLQSYDHAAVLRAWEATHHFVVDEYVTKRSRPAWDTIWMMPVFQVQLKEPTGTPPRVADGAFDATKCCISWNVKQGRRCVKNPEPTCTKLHLCMRCGGEHRICECTRE